MLRIRRFGSAALDLAWVAAEDMMDFGNMVSNYGTLQPAL